MARTLEEVNEDFDHSVKEVDHYVFEVLNNDRTQVDRLLTCIEDSRALLDEMEAIIKRF
jgi:hypothetical protein